MKKLPKKFGGAKVMRGLGMKQKPYKRLSDKSLDDFNASGDLWIVLDDRALRDHSYATAFKIKEDAIRFARAEANGNVDQRVLRVTEQILVIATENDL